MAQTYTLAATAVTMANNKSLIAVFNDTGSGRIVRLYRAWILNNQHIAIAGSITMLELRRITTRSAGVTITPLKHNSSSENFPSQVTAATNSTVTTSDLFIRAGFSTDEPASATLSIDEIQLMPALNVIWDVGYNDSNIEPIVCREGQGVSLQNVGATTGQVDVFFEITLANS